MDFDIIFAGRVIERILIILFGGMSLFLGFKLFSRIDNNEYNGDVEAKSGSDLYIKVRNVAPGVFFAAFGSIVLAISMQSPVVHSLNNSNGNPNEQLRHSFSILSDSEPELAKKAASIKLITDFYLENQKSLSKEELRLYQGAAVISKNMVRDIVDYLIGDGSYDLYEQSRRGLDSATPTLIQQYPEHERTIVRKVEKLLRQSLPQEH